jgi:hypothetical protein
MLNRSVAGATLALITGRGWGEGFSAEQVDHLPSPVQGALTCMAPEAVRAENSGRYMSSTLAAGCA